MAQELSIALIQSTLAWQEPEKNRKQFADRMASMEVSVDLIVLPEMFTTGFTMSPEKLDMAEGAKTLEWMQSQAAIYNAALIGSVPYHEDRIYTNRLFFVKPDGTYQFYDKRHTFTLAGEHLKYTAGKKRLILAYRGFSICPMVCYDLRFPVWSRNTEDYDILLYVANWPKPRIAAWDTLLKARAIENMAYCIGVNRVGKDPNGNEYSGHSAVYDCLGEQLGFSAEETILHVKLSRAHLEATRSKLRFLDDRDLFTLKP